MKRMLTLIGLCFFFTACLNTKKITYFNDVTQRSGVDSSGNATPLLIEPGDVLQVTITTVDKDVSAMFNPHTEGPAQGYMVDASGNIELPVIGKLQVKGMTTGQINERIKALANQTLKNAYVSTRLANLRVSVLGDVAHPGSYPVQGERVSILDALSLAGDANTTAIRSDVMLIREEDGVKRYVSLDLSDSKLLSSPYYYLKNNDVIYVKPGRNKVFAQSRGVILLPTIIAALSLITTLIIISRN